MVVVGRWRHKGGPLEPHPIFIFQTIFRSNLITMIKRELWEPVAKFDIIPRQIDISLLCHTAIQGYLDYFVIFVARII